MVSIRLTSLCPMLLMAVLPGSVQAAAAAAPAELSSIGENRRTQVLVLATPHLRELGKDLNRKAVYPLMARLQSFAPDAVGVESLPPSVIRSMKAQGDSFAPVLNRFAGDALQWGKRARKILALPYKELMSETSALLAAGADRPDDRRALALRLLALGNVPSAVLQWAYLDAGRRGGGNDVPPEIADFLTEKLGSSNEIYALAVPLAKRLGHNRLASIDDHSDKNAFLPIADELNTELQKHPLLAEVQSAQLYKDARDILLRSNRNENLVPAYRFYNSADYGRKDVRTQWDLFLRTRLKSGLDRTRLALWDVRNFLIAAHVRRLTAEHPGGRILIIIGASHKPFLEAFLSQAMDIRIVPAEEVLGRGP